MQPLHASDPCPQAPDVFPGAEHPGHAVLSTATNYPPRKTHFKLRAYSRRLPSNAPATAVSMLTAAPPHTCVPREQQRAPRAVAALQALLATPCSCSITSVCRLQEGRREGQVVSAQCLAASAEPPRVPARLSPAKRSQHQAATSERHLCPPRPAAKEGLRPITLS